jgi:hypothetical protein
MNTSTGLAGMTFVNDVWPYEKLVERMWSVKTIGTLQAAFSGANHWT